MTAVERIRQDLLALADPQYRTFQSALMPNVDPARVMGVRMPVLRAYAKKLAKTPAAEEFLQALPHTYYEENNLHALLIEPMTDCARVFDCLDVFLPHVDNWATCDLLRPKVLCRHLPELEARIRIWITSPHPYTVRFGLEMLMIHFLDDAFRAEYIDLAASVTGEDYYVRMMVAWYFATALAKQYDAVLPVLQTRRLARWTHNKAIQKAIESFRVPQERKDYLRTLRY